ncbi:hypothetical protein HAX54_008616 [Datura stramonium]|uniref:Uncharacterized protein n=1 Tax=Datura stramonium TaxID=4076 RepID=A0ABS8TFB3_DATST|nr:hypothetical protein [Datura stramonium]
MKETSSKLLDAFVDLSFEFMDQSLSPSQSNFAPVEEIGEAVRVTEIQGEIPDDFPEGVYIRNGSNPLFGGLKSTKSIFGKSSHLWIEGEGMLHALYFTKEKRRKWNILYKNKYVETDTFNMEKHRKKPGFLPNMEGDALAVLMASLLNVLRFGVLHKYISNTNVFEHSKKYYSIAENHMPQEINIQTLETLGNWTVNGDWSQPFTAHPKKVSDTGELVIMGINPLKPYLEVGVISAKNLSGGFAKFGGLAKLHFEERQVEISKDEKEKEDLIKVVEYHIFPKNTFCTGATFVPKLDGVDEDDGWIMTFTHNENTNQSQKVPDIDELVIMEINPLKPYFELGVISEKNLSGGFAKFGGLAKIRFEGIQVEISKDEKEEEEEDLIKVEYHIFPKNTFCSGAAFVPKHEGVDEDDGWMVAFTHNENTNQSQKIVKRRIDDYLYLCMSSELLFAKASHKQIQGLESLSPINFEDLSFEFVDQPLSPSQSNFAPVEEIGEAVRITEIQGKIPDDFPEGVYIRNGANPLFGGLKSTKSIFGKSSHLWIEGEGMLHALYFTKEKRRKWNILYKNKYVETDTFNMEKYRKKPGFLPNMEGDALAVLMACLLNVLRFGVLHKYLSNTNVFEHSKKYYSIAENHMPQEINIQTLETLGNWTVNGAWNRSFTAHPKKTPGTGELVITGTYPLKPYFELGVISADGKQMVHKVDLKFNKCILCHEIGVTMRYNVILDFPLTLDLNRLISGEQLIEYNKDGYSRIGIMPRYGDANSIKWFEVEPCYVFHLINCFEHNDEVVVRACRARRWIIPRPDLIVDEVGLSLDGLNEMSSSKDNVQLLKELFSFFHVSEWRLNMKTGGVKMKDLTIANHDQFIMEFPMINEHFIGLRNRFGYLQLVNSEAFSNFGKNLSGGFAKFGGLAKIHFEERQVEISKDENEEEDLVKVEYHIFPKNTFCSGAAFVPKHEGVDEDDGWIVAFTHNENTNQSHVYIVDAKKFESEPVAIIILPNRVPYGFHGAFMPLNL